MQGGRVELVLELNSRQGAQTVLNALDAYEVKLRASIERTRRNLLSFEAEMPGCAPPGLLIQEDKVGVQLQRQGNGFRLAQIQSQAP